MFVSSISLVVLEQWSHLLPWHFQHSLAYNLLYKYLISDGDSKTFSLLSQEQVYRPNPEDQVKKTGLCWSHSEEIGDGTTEPEGKVQGTETQ